MKVSLIRVFSVSILFCFFVLSLQTYAFAKWPLKGEIDTTGLKVIRIDDNYKEGQYQAYLAKDGVTQIIKIGCDVSPINDGESWDGYMARITKEAFDVPMNKVRVKNDEKSSARLTYPVSIISWTNGSGEDARFWEAFAFGTDSLAYFFAFSTPADKADDVAKKMRTFYDKIVFADE